MAYSKKSALQHYTWAIVGDGWLFSVCFILGSRVEGTAPNLDMLPIVLAEGKSKRGGWNMQWLKTLAQN